jgi:NAD-dependent deacetylase
MTNIVILTGAGISAESGIQTFRDSNGLWNNHRVEDVATPEGFKNNPRLVNDFYNVRRAELKTVEPNDGHRALAKLEEAWKDIGGFLLITQNVDDLHERAGSKNIAHMHGELRGIRCTGEDCRNHGYTDDNIGIDTLCEDCGSPMRPDVVWFGEFPKYLSQIDRVLDNTDILIVIGTSGQVMPASLFPTAVRHMNPKANIIEVNPDPTRAAAFNYIVEGAAAVVLPVLVDNLIEQCKPR